MSKEKRKKELENEMRKLQSKLHDLDDEDEYIPDEDEEEFNFDPFTGERIDKAKVNPVVRVRSRAGPSPPMPPMPPMPPRARRARTVRVDLTPEEKAKVKKEKERIKVEKEKSLKEIKKMRSELYKKQKDLNEKQKEFAHVRSDLREHEREIRNKERDLRARRYHQEHDSWDPDIDQEIEVLTSDLEMRLGDYTRSILSSVAESMKSSMGIAVKGAGNLGEEIKIVGKDLGKLGKEIGDKINKEIYVTMGPTIPEDKLEEFYTIGATIVGAIGDSNRLMILKELEKGPKYQKELSDITSLRGGTFKHHMDRLLDENVRFVTQEVVRGRYLLTTRGREALKLAEMQYMRYLENKERQKREKHGKNGKNSDEEFDVSIK
ncbi:MAG: winged helix-turn-helix domain-containing protein [Candidatus Heimdallarchaeota archaeon]